MAPGFLGALAWVLAVQAGQPAVMGTIRDGESGALLSNAVVALTDANRSAVTDAEGRYRLEATAAGPQHLSVKRIGYEPRIVHALVPGEGVLQLDLSLNRLPLQLPTVVVRSRVAIRGLERDGYREVLDRSISAAALRNHPLLAEPDGFLALGGGSVSATPEAPSGVHLHGGAADHTAYQLDGVPVFSPYHAAGTFSAWNPDALEQVATLSATPSLAPPDALAGTVAGTTRTPGGELRTSGALSTTHARLTIDGPLGAAGAGFLLSVRSGFPGVVTPEDDPSYLQGRTGDLLAKVEAPALHGRLRVLLYDSRNRLDAAARAEARGVATDRQRNGFEWDSRSAGVAWSRALDGGAVVHLQGWNARGEAESEWGDRPGSRLALEADREDQGLLGTVERIDGDRLTGLGVRLQRSRTSYHVARLDEMAVGSSLDSRVPIASLLARHREPLAAGLSADLALSVTAAAGEVHLGPRAELRWSPGRTLSLAGSYTHAHQFAQSLRNPEAVSGGIFPADLFLGPGASNVPVARSDRIMVGAELRPLAGVRLGTQAYVARFDRLLLVAPASGQPFATDGFTEGRGTARGASVEAAVSGRWYGALASWGLQDVRALHGRSSYVPGHGTSHVVELGLIVFPVPTASVRLGFTGAMGRRGTGLLGAFEWESCNLLDQGCEFAGSPSSDRRNPGGTRLPDYLRLDLGARKHWHLGIGGRDVEFGFFGTLTNVFGRHNVLTVATDPSDGQRSNVEMRPFAPLVLGLDWRF
ncbi:MAG TPA: carboxypeptidase regulatory-like domain-containing protein [Gemmatimonadales bacterium]|nr:carboxypeptidase regulatory-like domain-containing protein [Gemmatimonadales bacterium]